MQMKDWLPQLRGEIKTKAQGAVSGIYGISSQLSKEEIKALVKMLCARRLLPSVFLKRYVSCIPHLFLLIISSESVSVFSRMRYSHFFLLSSGSIRARNLPRALVTMPHHSTRSLQLSLHSLQRPLSAHSGAGSQARTGVSISQTMILRRYTADILKALRGLRRSNRLIFNNSAVLSGWMLGMSDICCICHVK